MRLRSSSTLFPYTTLFRSLEIVDNLILIMNLYNLTFHFEYYKVHQYKLVLLCFYIRFANDRVDRKSTRLNSSHVAISYAVFCLKKIKLTLNAVRSVLTIYY